MKYTKDNVLGIKFNIGSSQYLVKKVGGIIGLWGMTSKEGDYSINCGHSAQSIADSFNKGYWKVEESILTYEIY